MVQPAIPYEVIPLVGADGAGKTTLFRAMEQAARARDYGVASRPIQMDGRSAFALDVRGATRVRQLVDFADAETEHALLGATRAHGAILVVSALDSVVPGTRESLDRARHLSIPVLAVALTNFDRVEDAELTDLVTMEIRDQLTRFGAQGDRVQVVPTPAKRGEPREGRQAESEPSGADGVLWAIRAWT
jgi:selenocysteine-specific translation elongation factor